MSRPIFHHFPCRLRPPPLRMMRDTDDTPGSSLPLSPFSPRNGKNERTQSLFADPNNVGLLLQARGTPFIGSNSPRVLPLSTKKAALRKSPSLSFPPPFLLEQSEKKAAKTELERGCLDFCPDPRTSVRRAGRASSSPRSSQHETASDLKFGVGGLNCESYQDQRENSSYCYNTTTRTNPFGKLGQQHGWNKRGKGQFTEFATWEISQQAKVLNFPHPPSAPRKEMQWILFHRGLTELPSVGKLEKLVCTQYTVYTIRPLPPIFLHPRFPPLLPHERNRLRGKIQSPAGRNTWGRGVRETNNSPDKNIPHGGNGFQHSQEYIRDGFCLDVCRSPDIYRTLCV